MFLAVSQAKSLRYSECSKAVTKSSSDQPQYSRMIQPHQCLQYFSPNWTGSCDFAKSIYLTFNITQYKS